MKNRLFATLLGIALAMALCGCGVWTSFEKVQKPRNGETVDGSVSAREENGYASRENELEEMSGTEEVGVAASGVVLVRDENGREAQVLDGYLYGFWDGVLYRYDLESGERIVLYESVVKGDLKFWIYEGSVYFTERNLADTLTFMDTRLYQVACDGSGVRLLSGHVPDDRDEDRYAWPYYDIMVYKNVIYLQSQNGEDLYYRLEDGDVTRLREEDYSTFHYERFLESREEQRIEGGQIPESYREILAAYAEERHAAREKAIAYYEMWEYGYEPATENNRYSLDILPLYDASVRRLVLIEDTDGARVINRYMKKVFDEIQEEYLAYPAENRERLEENFTRQNGTTYDHTYSGISYLDERFVNIYVVHESFNAGGLHPGNWGEEYLFDRTTGERLVITDLVENTPEEIMNIVTSYIEKDHPGFAESEWPGRESILEEDRLYLTESGIGIDYETEELGSHGEGGMSYIIPFWEFDMKVEMAGNYEDRRRERRDRYSSNFLYSAYLNEEKGWEEGYWKPEELEAVLAEEWKAGTLMEYLEEHNASDSRALSQEEIFSIIREDYTDDQKYRLIRETCGDSEKWFVFEEECDNVDVVVVPEGGLHYWVFDGNRKGISVWEEGADCFFLRFEGDGYLVFPYLGEDGEVTVIHTYGMFMDPYNGWQLWQRMEADGSISKGWSTYTVNF